MRAWIAALLAGLTLAWAAPAIASPFSDWAAVVVAGDFHAHSGGPSEAFDNARRDVAKALEQAGFSPANVRQFSVRPDRYPDTHPAFSGLQEIYDGLSEAAAMAPGGCLFYMSSHGSPAGAVLGERILSPGVLDTILEKACGSRPTVVVISACFSGVFVPTLARPNRMVLTAARPDRSSFGCGEADRYPYFDDCFLQSIREAREFPSLARDATACVAAREKKEGMKPPSEPQTFIGGAVRPLLPLETFAAPTTSG